VLFYPPCVLYLVELLRINYLGSSRFFPVALALFALYAAARVPPQRPSTAPARISGRSGSTNSVSRIGGRGGPTKPLSRISGKGEPTNTLSRISGRGQG
jgi:hypothetical protein